MEKLVLSSLPIPWAKSKKTGSVPSEVKKPILVPEVAPSTISALLSITFAGGVTMTSPPKM